MRSNGVVLNLGVFQDRQQIKGVYVAAEIVNIRPPRLHLSAEATHQVFSFSVDMQIRGRVFLNVVEIILKLWQLCCYGSSPPS